MKTNYCIYIHTNKTNGKLYIGQTCQAPERRWRKGQGYKNSTHFYSAIQKYGWDGFEHEVIASNLTQDEANNFEELLINKLNTTNSAFGYNLQRGGSNHSVTEEVRQKISDNHANVSGVNNPNYRKPSVRRKAVKCLETGVIYPFVRDAEEKTGINRSNISRCCSGKRQTAGGYHWEYCNA